MGKKYAFNRLGIEIFVCRVAADYYAMGVIAYECMLGKRPYIGRTRKELRD